jgi:GrpB-like predicted nucleotidyltransferase (UPF0157 family)
MDMIGHRARRPDLALVGATPLASGHAASTTSFAELPRNRSSTSMTDESSATDRSPHLATEQDRVSDRPPLSCRIVLVDSDPQWPWLYDREAVRIRAALGALALQIEHVGSTAVPGLAAKPIIDILLVVENSADESAYLPQLEQAGYVLLIREPDWFEHRLLKGAGVDINLHVFSNGCSEISRLLVFRDCLLKDQSARERYERVKRELAKQTWGRVQDYADAKTAVIAEILESLPQTN